MGQSNFWETLRRPLKLLLSESALFYHAVDLDQGVEQIAHARQWPRVGAVGQSLRWVRVCFHEHTGDASGHGGARQYRHELALATRSVALAAGLLH